MSSQIEANRPRSRRRQLLPLMGLAIAAVLWFGCQRLASQTLKPQVALVLGGSTPALEREKFAAKWAQQHPGLPIWISGGSPKQYTIQVFAKAGIERQRLHLDYRAQDTLTNFTTMVDDLDAKGIRSVYLITSDFHMNRARVLAELILGSRGIAVHTVAVPSSRDAEPIEKSLRDGARAIVWMATGFTGVSTGNTASTKK